MDGQDKIFGYSIDDLLQLSTQYGLRLISAITLLVIGFWLSRFLSKTLRRLMLKREVDASLVGFISSLISTLIKVLVIVTAITQLGIEMTSFVAILASAGLAIGMAFSGTLSNFAGGVMILLFKPFQAGDFIKVQGEEGFVRGITIFNTIIITTDNKVVTLPNGLVSNGVIINYTKEKTRRVEWKIGISYGDDLKTAKEVLLKFIQEDQRILNDPAPSIALGELADSSIVITTRAWVKTEDFWNVYFDMMERVYNEFGSENLNFPFPHMDVLIRQND